MMQPLDHWSPASSAKTIGLWQGMASALFVHAIFLASLTVAGDPAGTTATPPDKSHKAASQTSTTRASSTVPAPVSITNLIITLTGEADAPSRKTAAVAILRQASEEADKALLDILDRANNDGAKLAISHAIAEVGSQNPAFASPLLGFLNANDQALRDAAEAALAGYNDPKIAAKLHSFRQRQQNKLLVAANIAKAKLLYSLLPKETDRVAQLQQWLTAKLILDRLTALEIVHDAMLRTPPTPPAVEVLTQIRTMLTDPDESVRLQVVIVLRDLQAKEDAPHLLTLLGNERAEAVREEIYKALGRMGDMSSVPGCVHGLRHGGPREAAAAADALGRLLTKGNGERRQDHREAIDALIKVARSARVAANARLREQVIDAMAEIANEKFLPVFEELADKNEKVPTIRQAALRGIGRVDGGAAPIELVLDRLVNDSNAGVREAAAEALGVLGSTANHLQALQSRLDVNVEPSGAVTQKAWEAYRLVFLRLAPEEQETVLAEWDDKDQVTATRRIELLADLEAAVGGTDPLRAARIREDLGDAHAARGQHDLAAGFLSRALEVFPANNVEDRIRVAPKVVNAYLNSDDPSMAISSAARVAREAKVRDAVAVLLLDYLRQTRHKDMKQAAAFLDELDKAVPDLFGQAWKHRFETQREAIQPASKPRVAPSPSTKPVSTQPLG